MLRGSSGSRRRVHDRDLLLEPGPLVRTTGDLEREAAHELDEISRFALNELGLGPDEARMLMRQIAEAYMTGRADGINVFPPQADRALSAEGIAIALGLQYGRIIPAPQGAGTRPSEPREGTEAMARDSAHSVPLEVAVDWDDPESLIELLAALEARPEFLQVPVGAHVRRHVIGMTLTVGAATEKAAEEIATRVLIDEMDRLGLV
jgi:hypothetical protein